MLTEHTVLPLIIMIAGVFKHIRCINTKYPRSTIDRFFVPEELTFWHKDYPLYSPPYYDAAVLAGKPWSDPRIDSQVFLPKWNELDGEIDRRSHGQNYEIVSGYPRNPWGRTGVRGRGVLGRWGPNHAADPVVTRWKRNISGGLEVDSRTGLNILQMCAIERHDCGEWALPGGMVDPGENVSETLRREFMEEALNTNVSSTLITNFFAEGRELYKGYVDDPRNTDNAWMETVAVNFHDQTGEYVGRFQLSAGDDAAKVKWMDIDKGIKLYASHSLIVEKVVEIREAHW